MKTQKKIAVLSFVLILAGPVFAGPVTLGPRFVEADAQARGIVTSLDTVTRGSLEKSVGDEKAHAFTAGLARVRALSDKVAAAVDGSDARLALDSELAAAQLQVATEFGGVIGTLASGLDEEIPVAERKFKQLQSDPYVRDATTKELAAGEYSPRTLAIIAIQDARALRDYLGKLRIAADIARRSATRLTADGFVAALKKAGVTLKIPKLRPCTLTSSCAATDLDPLPTEPAGADPATGEFSDAIKALSNP